MILGRTISWWAVTLTACVLLSSCNQQSSEPDSRIKNEVPIQASDESVLDSLSGRELFIACQGCHTIAPGGVHGVGPNLYGIVGMAAATQPDFTYSAVLESSEIIWNRGSLTAWILQAESMVPGTWMAYNNILSAEEVPKLVSYIIRASASQDRDTTP